VEAELHKHPELQGVDRIHVQTVNHVVYLTGRVSEGMQARMAESAARETKGVSQVENSIAIEK
jgi:osmotically-inducible protein OsmY